MNVELPSPAAAPKFGFGCPSDGVDVEIAKEVARFLRAGSPRLALATARCVPLQPTLASIRATFPSTSTTDVPNIGMDVNQKFTQDTVIEKMVILLVNEGMSANSNIQQTLSDYFYNYQSGIDAKVHVTGGPKYSPVSVFTPLPTIAQMVGNSEKWPYGWILGLSQQITMDFHANITLPDAPYEVICTFRGWCAQGDAYNATNMSSKEALDALEGYGYKFSQAYRDCACR